MKPNFCILILLFFCFLAEVCIAQQGMLPQRMVSSGRMGNLNGLIVITNNTGGAKIYANSNDNINWNAQNLASGYRHIYQIQSLLVRIISNSGKVQYRLQAGSSYSISWNQDKGIWDIYRDP